MKKHTSLFMLMTMVAIWCQAQGVATLTGRIQKPQTGDTLYVYVQDQAHDGYDTIVIDKKGRFSYATPVSTDMTEALVFGNEVDASGTYATAYCVLLQAGKSLEAEITLHGTPCIKFKGEGSAKSTYANQFYQTFSHSWEFNPDSLAAHCTSYSEAAARIDASIAPMQKTLTQIDDSEFVKMARAALVDQREGALFGYAVSSEAIGRHMTADADFMTMVNAIDPNDTAQTMQIYQYLEWYYAANPGLYMPMTAMGAKLKYLGQYTQNQAVRNSVANIYMMNIMFLASWGLDTTSSEYRDLYEQYLAVSTDTTYVAFCNENLKAMASQTTGEPAIDFTIQDLQGNSLQFADILKGHVTYVDFWATWCGPCKGEIPHLERMTDYFRQQGTLWSESNPDGKLRVVSISIDARRSDWEKMLAKDQPQWEQFIIPDASKCEGISGYNIQSIPRFMIFDANGCLFRSAASRPSEAETKPLLESLMK